MRYIRVYIGVPLFWETVIVKNSLYEGDYYRVIKGRYSELRL